MPAWPTVAIQLIVYVLTIGVFVGTMRQMVKALTEAVGKLETRMARFDSFATESQVDRGRLNERLDSLERDDALLKGLNDQLIELRTETRIELRHLAQSTDKTARELGAVQRQLANLASGKARGVEFPASDS